MSVTYKNLQTESWSDYELLDSGDNMKLERFGDIVLARPETQALWHKRKPELWKKAHATFSSKSKNGSTDKPGSWTTKSSVPDSWNLSWNGLRFSIRLTSFKHTGLFPEQAPNWAWLQKHISMLSEQKKVMRKQSGRPEGGDPRTFPQQSSSVQVLNLFGYTGIASLVAAKAGARVTHVDASKQSLDWAHDNARLSELPETTRWILDDALAFAKREVRRGTKYDGIILDPPAFGRGAKGEVWHIEEDLSTLLETLAPLLNEAPGSFFLLNGYAAGYASRSFVQAVEDVFDVTNGEAGELLIQESGSERVIPAGIYTRFIR